MTVVLTRAPEDNAAMARRATDAGARVLEVPCVRVEPLADAGELAAAIADCDAGDWLIVTSRAGADAVARAPRPRCRAAAVGASTAARLREHGIDVAFVPSAATGESLARELPAGAAALLARSDRALPDLPEILRSRGFRVREVIAYRTVPGATGDVNALRAALASGERVAVLCASPSAVDALAVAIDPSLLERAEFVASGRTTQRAIRERIGDAARIETIEQEAMHVARR